MAYLIPIFIIILSTAGVAYIITRKIRILSERSGGELVYPEFENRVESDDRAGLRRDSIENILRIPYLQKLFNIKEGGAFFIFTEKFFRKMRVRLMKVENWLAEVSKNLHERGLRGRPSSNHSSKIDKEEIGKSGDDAGPASFVSLNDSTGELDEQYWLNILKENPTSIYPYKKLGDIYMARENFREARSFLKYALKLDPADDTLRGMLGELKGKRTSKK